MGTHRQILAATVSARNLALYHTCMPRNYCYIHVNRHSLHCAAICSSPCQNGGTCTGPNRCTCPPNWTGSICNEGIINMPYSGKFSRHRKFSQIDRKWAFISWRSLKDFTGLYKWNFVEKILVGRTQIVKFVKVFPSKFSLSNTQSALD